MKRSVKNVKTKYQILYEKHKRKYYLWQLDLLRKRAFSAYYSVRNDLSPDKNIAIIKSYPNIIFHEQTKAEK